MTDEELNKMLAWAQGKIAAGEEPPWAYATYQQLIGALEKIIAGRAVTISLEDSLRLPKPDPLPEGVTHIDSARPVKVVLPM
jgi:hypothetical protein